MTEQIIQQGRPSTPGEGAPVDDLPGPRAIDAHPPLGIPLVVQGAVANEAAAAPLAPEAAEAQLVAPVWLPGEGAPMVNGYDAEALQEELVQGPSDEEEEEHTPPNSEDELEDQLLGQIGDFMEAHPLEQMGGAPGAEEAVLLENPAAPPDEQEAPPPYAEPMDEGVPPPAAQNGAVHGPLQVIEPPIVEEEPMEQGEQPPAPGEAEEVEAEVGSEADAEAEAAGPAVGNVEQLEQADEDAAPEADTAPDVDTAPEASAAPDVDAAPDVEANLDEEDARDRETCPGDEAAPDDATPAAQ